MKRYFMIEWKEDLGPMWMNRDNLLICLNTNEHCGEGLIVNVQDITDEVLNCDTCNDCGGQLVK